MQIINDRRALHRIPELDRQLPETIQYIKNALSGLRCEVLEPMEGAVCAWFDFGADWAIAFRSDADALPIAEQNDVDYKSAHPGSMHACGHDGHMAMALELARRISAKETLNKNILIVFQPAEETTGGAKDLCAAGIFDQHNVRAIFGMHLWPGLAEGTIASRENEMMARSCEVTVDVYGKSAHIAKAWEGVDALEAAAKFYTEAYAMERALPEHLFRLLKFGKFQSGTVRNALSAHTHLEGSLRAFQDEIFFGLRDGLREIAWKVETEFGCKINVHTNDGYPAVMNPPELYRKVKALVHFTELDEPMMITEDFSWYQRSLPGMFFFLGTGDTPALHADNFNFNEEILVNGADFLEELAVQYK